MSNIKVVNEYALTNGVLLYLTGSYLFRKVSYYGMLLPFLNTYVVQLRLTTIVSNKSAIFSRVHLSVSAILCSDPVPNAMIEEMQRRKLKLRLEQRWFVVYA